MAMIEQRASRILVISSSASTTSRSEKLGQYMADRFGDNGAHVEHLRLRTLPAAPLLAADASNAEIAAAMAMVDAADGIVIVTPTYKATYSGLLKVFVDLLPQYALRGKSVLPLATGGTIAHVLMLDYGLRPVLQTMWPRHIGQGCFVIDKHLIADGERGLSIDEASSKLLDEVVDAFRFTLEEPNAPRSAGLRAI